MRQVPSYEKVQQIQSLADITDRDYWVYTVVFTYQWWLLLALMIIPYIVWWKVVERKKFFEITTYGLLVALFTGLLDAIGLELDIWDYKYDLVPLLDVLIVYDVSILPITYMLIYQYFRTWRSFAVTHLIIAFVFAFLFEPILVWLDIYHPYKWTHSYSFVGYFLVAIFLRWLMIQLNKKSKSC